MTRPYSGRGRPAAGEKNVRMSIWIDPEQAAWLRDRWRYGETISGTIRDLLDEAMDREGGK